MVVIRAKSLSGGISIGRIKQFKKKEIEISNFPVDDVETEIFRYREASQRVQAALEKLYEQALMSIDKESAEIFSSHQMLLYDGLYVETVEEKIRHLHMNGAAAVALVRDELKKMFETMEDAYIRERARDVVDVSNRLIQELLGIDEERFEYDDSEAFLLFADDLTPGELVQMNKNGMKALVTRFGSEYSHTSVLARTMHIPVLLGAAFPENCEGKTAIVDGEEGIIYMDPDRTILDRMNERMIKDSKCVESLNVLKGKEDKTSEGKKICLYANAGNISDVLSALDHDAAGIGLFRTELLFLENEKEPTEEEQFQIYKCAVEMMAGKKVIFRTADIGSDKPVKYRQYPVEENPAMGYRAIRISLDHPESLKCQLRALYRASAYGSLSLMYPMVASVTEVEKLKHISREVRQELLDAGVCIGDVEEGIMIETPAAALISDRLAKMVDFFSIGTNDLSAFTLAMDRTNSKLNGFFDPDHEAIFRLIEMCVKNGHEAGIWVGICGEMAADLRWTKYFIEIGVDEFSVTPSMILPLRQKIRE